MKYQFVRGLYEKDGTITIYARNENGKKEKITVFGFQPYFFVPADVSIPDDERIESIERGYKGIYGEELQKIVVKKPTDVRDMRGSFAKHYEADIRFVRRFLIDTGIRCGFEIPNRKKIVHYKEIKPVDFDLPPVIAYIDVECYSSSRVPDPEKAEDTVTCLTIYDTTNKKYCTLLLDDKEERKHLDEDHILISVRTEKKLFNLLKNYLSNVNPDVLTEWSKFDHVYLKNRGKILGVNLDFDGTCVFDMLDGYAKLYKKASNRLKDVVIEEGLTDFQEPEVDYAELWEDDRERLIKRNKRHVEWIVKLDELKKGLIRFYWDMKNTAGLEDLQETLYHGVLVDTMLLRKYYGKYVLPSKPEIIDKEEKYPGALVLKPPKGLFDNVATYDFSRYYPNIIIGKNLTPEKTTGVGLVPQLCLDLMKKRNEYEALMRTVEVDSDEYNSIKSKRNSVKYLLNAVYGYFGSVRSRLYSKFIASEVTRIGRNGLLHLIDISEKLGYKVLYSDTDSILIQVPRSEIKSLEKSLNDALRRYCESLGIKATLKLKCDRFFKTALFTGVKKRMAGRVVEEDGRECDYLYIIGFEFVRRDSSKITKKIQKDILDMILKNDDVRKKIPEYVMTLIKDMKNGKYSLDEIAIRKTLNKRFDSYKAIPDYLRGTFYANTYLGENIKPGDTVKMLYVKRVPGKPRTDVICFLESNNVPEGTIIDWDKMISRTVKQKIENMVSLVGLSWQLCTSKNTLLTSFS